MAKYVKCDQCVAAGNTSKMDVFVVAENGKVNLRCAHHGGKGKVFTKPLDEHYPSNDSQEETPSAPKLGKKSRG